MCSNSRSNIAIVFFCLVVFGAGFLAGGQFRRFSRQIDVKTDTLVVERTIVDSGAFLAIAKNRGYELVRTTSLDSLKDFANRPEKTVYIDKPTVIVRDSIVYVQVPVEERTFTGSKDSVDYRIVTTGYDVNVQSVAFKYPQTTIYRTETIDRTKRLGFGVTAGPAVLVTPAGKPAAGLGIVAGISWRF